MFTSYEIYIFASLYGLEYKKRYMNGRGLEMV